MVRPSSKTGRDVGLRPVKRLLSWMCVAYGLLAVAGVGTKHREIFPFFSWFLFPLTPQPGVRYQLVLEEVAGQRLEPATSFERAAPWVETHSLDAQVLVGHLASAIEGHDDEAIEHWRRVLEARFMTAPCRYVIVRRWLDPLRSFGGEPDHWRVTLASFSCERESAAVREQ